MMADVPIVLPTGEFSSVNGELDGVLPENGKDDRHLTDRIAVNHISGAATFYGDPNVLRRCSNLLCDRNGHCCGGRGKVNPRNDRPMSNPTREIKNVCKSAVTQRNVNGGINGGLGTEERCGSPISSRRPVRAEKGRSSGFISMET